jgi:hypothetical protein
MKGEAVRAEVPLFGPEDVAYQGIGSDRCDFRRTYYGRLEKGYSPCFFRFLCAAWERARGSPCRDGCCVDENRQHKEQGCFSPERGEKPMSIFELILKTQNKSPVFIGRTDSDDKKKILTTEETRSLLSQNGN